jgi:hypothetical protein
MMHLRTDVVNHGSRLYAKRQGTKSVMSHMQFIHGRCLLLEAKFEIVNLFSIEEIAAFVEKDLQIKVVGPG